MSALVTDIRGTRLTTAVGRNLAEAYGNLIADQSCTWDDVTHIHQVLNARCIAHGLDNRDFPYTNGHDPFDGDDYEVWEFEVYAQ